MVSRVVRRATARRDFGSISRWRACQSPLVCEDDRMTPEPADKVRRPASGDPITDATQAEALSGPLDRDDDAPASDLDGPRRARGSLSGSMPALRGPRDRGRRD
jgi:hypothetical protein